jgi:Mn-dependent DtxR family transcriptional regulator
MSDDKKEMLIEELKKKSKNKSKFYFSDLAKILDEKPRAAKKFVNELVTEGKLTYWSSGSTTMYSLPGMGKQAAAEGESKEEE